MQHSQNPRKRYWILSIHRDECCCRDHWIDVEKGVDWLRLEILIKDRVTPGWARPAKRWISSHTGLLDQCCATKAVKLIKGFVRSSGSNHPELQEEMLHKYNIEMPEKWARLTEWGHEKIQLSWVFQNDGEARLKKVQDEWSTLNRFWWAKDNNLTRKNDRVDARVPVLTLRSSVQELWNQS